jgi:type I restriction enzyme R subunit
MEAGVTKSSHVNMATIDEMSVQKLATERFRAAGFRLADARELTPETAPSERPDASQAVLAGQLALAIWRLNPWLPSGEAERIIRTVLQPPHASLLENNRWFHTLLTDGVEVEYKDPRTGEARGGRARLIDFDDATKNEFLVVQQLGIVGPNGKLIRPDLSLYVNGLPLAVIELKDPSNPDADLWTATDQLGRYMETAPDLFVPNVLLVASDGLLTRVGSITSGRSRFMPWRPAEGGQPTLEALIRELFEPAALLDYIRSCVVFEEDERGNIAKKIAGYHQFRAERKARAHVVAALKPPAGVNTTEDAGKGGVVWHTQGSGKSLTMLMLAGALIREPALANPTIVVVTDRNDLDDQLFGTFAGGRALLRQAPVSSNCSTVLPAAWSSRPSTSSPKSTARSANARTSS